MKVKMFCNATTEELEKSINDFIDDKIIYDIKFQKHGAYIRALIMYDNLFTIKGLPVEDAKYILLKEGEN